MGRQQLTTFYVNGLLFGIEVNLVQEVIRSQEMTHVPLAPAVVEGLINLRGQIVTAIDLRRRLGLAPADEVHQRLNIVVRCGEEAVSLLVDEIGDVLDVEQAIFEQPPETLRGAARDLIRGTYKLPDRLLLVLNTEKTLQLTQ